MAEHSHDGEVDGERRFRHVNRRWLMNLIGTGAVAGLAGCGGGDGGETTTETTTATTTTATTTTGDDGGDGGDGDGGGSEDTTTTEGSIERYDNQPVMALYRRPAAPPDAQYQSYSPQGDTSWDGALSFVLLSRSLGNGQVYGEMASGWEYTPGLLEVSLHDDFYYWTGENIDADNVLLHWELENFHQGGDDLNAHPNVIRAEKTGDYSIRFALTDTWRETFAIVQTMEYWGPSGTTEYYRPLLQQFQDAANQDEIEDLRTSLEETTSKDPNPFNHNPFKITDATENKWIFKLRTPENNELEGDAVPHFVDEINYRNFEYIVGTEEQRENQLFLEGKVLSSGPGDFSKDDLPFPITSLPFSRATDQWSFLFNCSTPPTNDRHFRRAIAYMCNRKQYMQPNGVVPDKVLTPFMIGEREQRYVSSEVLDSLTDYGWDEVRREEATREMEAGGFERDSQGRWLFKQGENAGEPMNFTISIYVWQDHVGNQGTDFRQTLADWGIDIAVEKDDAHWGTVANGEYTWASAFMGGGIPPLVMATNFGQASVFGAGNPELPSTIEAPPVGQPDGSLQTYETRTMADRLAVTQDDQQFQEITNQLTWVYNQIVPRIGIEGAVQTYWFNDDMYDVMSMEEAPEKYNRAPFRRVWNTGAMSYNPDHNMG